jgi:biotin operon repressor
LPHLFSPAGLVGGVMSVELVRITGDDLPDHCVNPTTCPACSIWKLAGETDAAWSQRLRAMIAGTERRTPVSPGRPRRPDEQLLAVLSSDRWVTGRAVAAQLGVSATAARVALYRAQQRGAPIESRRRYGYRLRESAA